MADDIGSKLGFDASDAIASIQRLKKELDSYNAALEKVAGGSKNFNAAQIRADDILKRLSISSQIAVGHLRELATAQLKGATSANQFATAQANAAQKQSAFQKALGIDPNAAPRPSGDILAETSQQRNIQRLKSTELALRNVARGATDSGNQVKAGAEKGAQGAKSLELSWRSVVRVFGIQFAAQAVASLVNAFTDGVRAAREFEIRLAEIQTISKEFQEQGIDAVGDAISRLSEEFGRPVQDVAAGLYQTLSNQIGNAAESTRFLTQALEFSVAAVTTTEDAVDLLSGTLNAYGLSANSAERISDEFFKTIELGRVTGTELANSLGRVITVSAQLGIETAEVNAAIATLTIQGVKASDAVTQLLNVELKLIKPTEALKAVYNELGISSGEAGIALFGLQGFLEKITEVGGESATEIAQLFNQLRGTRGVIGLVGTATKKANQNLVEITKSAGAARKAFELINKTNAQQLTKELEAARAFLVNNFGRSIISVFKTVVQAIGGGRNAIIAFGIAGGILVGGSLIIFLKSAVAAMIALGLSTEGTTAAMIGLQLAIVALPVALVLGLAIGLGGVKNSGAEAREELAKLQKETDTGIKERVRGIQAVTRAQKAALNADVKLILESLRQKKIALNEELIANLGLQDEITNSLAKGVEAKSKIVDDFVKKLEDRVEDAKGKAKELRDEIDDLTRGIGERQFERGLRGATPAQEAQARQTKINELLKEARKLATGDEESKKRSLELLAEADKQAGRIADNDATRRLGEQVENRIRQEAFILERLIQNSRVEQTKEAQKTLDKHKETLETTKKIDAAQTKLPLKQKDLRKEIENNNNAIEEFKKTVEDLPAKTEKAFGKLTEPVGKIASTTEPFGPARDLKDAFAQTFFDDDFEKAKAEVGALGELKERVLAAIKSGDVAALVEIQKGLTENLKNVSEQAAESKGILGTIGSFLLGDKVTETKETLQETVRTVDDAIAALTNLKKAQAEASSLKDQTSTIKEFGKLAADNTLNVNNFNDALNGVGRGATAAQLGMSALGATATPVIEGLNSIQTVANSFSTSNIILQAQAAIVALRELAAAQSNAGGGGGGLFFRGGFVHRFSGGGFAPRGTDTVPAMLTPGEFVVNARDSKRFFSELVSINSGHRPIFRAEGGPVTNNIGDININVPDGGGPVDSRQLVREIRRQLKRGTARF